MNRSTSDYQSSQSLELLLSRANLFHWGSIDLFSLQGVKAHVKDSNDSFAASMLCVNFLFGIFTSLFDRGSVRNMESILKNYHHNGSDIRLETAVFMKKEWLEKLSDQKLKAVREKYKAIVYTLDNSQNAIKNSTIQERIKSNLEKYAKIAGKKSSIVMSSVIHYAGKWKDPLQLHNTSMKFKNVDGTQSTVEMMIVKPEAFSFQEEEDLQIIRIPFAGSIHMLIARSPKEDENFKEWLKNFRLPKLAAFINSLESQKVEKELLIPKISINFVDEKREGNVRLFIDTSFVINEEGINAQSGFSQDIVPRDIGSRASEESPRIILDYPFMFFIRDRNTNTTLLSGVVQKFNETKTI